MKKGCLIAACVFLFLIVGCVFTVFQMTHGVTEGANAFLAHLGAGEVQQAYDDASATLKAQQTEQAFDDTVTKLGLRDYASAYWNSRNVNNDRGQVEGTVTTRSGGSIPVHIDLIKESGKWRVYSVSAPAAGVASEPEETPEAGALVEQPIPSDERCKAMVLETLLAFNKAIKAHDFSAFEQLCSTAYQRQLPADKLLRNFRSFVDQQVDISDITEVDPIFSTPPAIGADELLVLNGSYPTTPNSVGFALKYTFENHGWKLHDLGVSIPARNIAQTRPRVPGEQEARKLAQDTLVAFNSAVQARDFTAFQAAGSGPFRAQVSPEKLLESFKEFIDRGLNLAGVKDVQPVFNPPPSITADEVLILEGSFPTRPKPVAFTLKYLREDDAWKMLGINVDLR